VFSFPGARTKITQKPLVRFLGQSILHRVKVVYVVVDEALAGRGEGKREDSLQS
jgi:hypothetical protein